MKLRQLIITLIVALIYTVNVTAQNEPPETISLNPADEKVIMDTFGKMFAAQ